MVDPVSLTRSQKAVLDGIRRFAHNRGYMPSVAELGRELGLAKSTVHFHIKALIEKGLLDHDGSDHGLRLLDDASGASPADAAQVPVIGTIAAGSPIDAYEDHSQTLAVPAHLALGRTFALRVAGNSMIEDGILDGDYVVVRRQSTVDDGEVAVALLDDGSATLKRVYRERNRIRLQPANAELEPFYVENVTVQGKVVGVLRLY